MGQTRYPSKIWVLRATSLSMLDNTVNRVCWIFYKMVGAALFSRTYLCIQPPLQTLPKIRSSTYVNFHLPFYLYLFTKPPLQHSLPLYLSNLSPFLFLRTAIPTIYTKIFSLPQPFSQFRLPQGSRMLGCLVRTDTVLISPFFLKVWQW